MKTKVKQKHPLDIHIGSKLRAARMQKKLSAIEVGNLLQYPVSYQQIYNYENGTHRVTAQGLYEFASLFDVDTNFFYEGYKESQQYQIEEIKKTFTSEQLESLRIILNTEKVRKKKNYR
jgi:transcriptional regulator with XRE-family HTH domain